MRATGTVWHQHRKTEKHRSGAEHGSGGFTGDRPPGVTAAVVYTTNMTRISLHSVALACARIRRMGEVTNTAGTGPKSQQSGGADKKHTLSPLLSDAHPHTQNREITSSRNFVYGLFPAIPPPTLKPVLGVLTHREAAVRVLTQNYNFAKYFPSSALDSAR